MVAPLWRAIALSGLAVLMVSATGAYGQDRDIRPSSSAVAPSAAGLYTNSWALVIGVNTYQRVPGLSYAVADAKAVAEALPAFGFPHANTRVLLNDAATKTAIEKVLYEDFAHMGPNDRLFVYFAGHGETAPIKGGEEGYILPADANPEALARTAIPMDEVRRIGRRVKAKHVLFVMDACFSGFAMTRDISPSPTDDYLATALREPVVQVITAGRKGEKALEDAGHGLFTRRLLDGLRILSEEGIVGTAQLAAWLEPRVVRDSKGKMTPQYGKLDGEGQFLFFRPGVKLAAISPPPPPPRIEAREQAVKAPPGSVEVPFAQLIQPAFSSDYARKTVFFHATYSSTMNVVADLPHDYRDGYVRVTLCSNAKPITFGGVSARTCENAYSNVLIPKAYSNAVLSLSEGAQVTVLAEALPFNRRTGYRGLGEPLFLIVKSINAR